MTSPRQRAAAAFAVIDAHHDAQSTVVPYHAYHRWFESSHLLMGTTCPHNHPGDWLLVFGHSVMERGHVVRQTPAGFNTTHRRHTTTARGREAMGIDWMNRDELSEAIPPAYTEYIGAQFAATLEAVA